MKTIDSAPISYRCYSSECGDILRKIEAWIAARTGEGWTIEMRIKEDDGRPVVMWQCIKNTDPRKNGWEFSPCIGMCGREFMMN